ncbi:MBL-fold metallo-hydrolase superfamily [Bathymodiolus thermophilus thioautotrophic gill symbiont]|uniref:MBL fold metallo-hydrolase n=1 Tax=Bathymodiolus thermophilus thioautotrophic gill symbiont TaxID=2360 RepID=UPI00192B86D3|nr:MBL fold metallo-hydrolase [Bathymodiolus thermophilus thioautotrophic gill symbiont]CAB5503314.1 MBL-fold metallo-hydrolase superfamily [Bathymodiolus thermophilus thioautotrophic gill symbiont]
MNPIYHTLDFGITCIDTQYMRNDFVAAYLIEDQGHVAFVDTGCYLSVPTLLATLDEKNIQREQVDYIILTHIHLDHAGGAGELIRHLPNAKVYVHEYGVNHLIDPSKLRAGVIGVYGELFFKQFLGDLIPIAKEKIVIAKDKDEITLGNRILKFINTPGHARHHVCIWDEKSQGIFSGDTLGVSYREFDTEQGALIFPPTTPVQFDPDVWKNTIQQLMTLQPKYAYLTHFNRIEFTKKSADMLIHNINNFVEIAIKMQHQPNRHKAIKTALLDYLLEIASKHGVTTEEIKQIKVFKGDLEICAQGLGVWLDKEFCAKIPNK